MIAIESLPSRILFSETGWTTFEGNEGNQSGESTQVSIPVSIEIQPGSDYDRRVLVLSGTANADVHRLTTATKLEFEKGIQNYVVFGYQGQVTTAIYDGNDDVTLDSAWWRFRADEWVKTLTFNGSEPMITGTWGNTRFYAPWETDLITADTGGGNDVIEIDPAIKVKTVIAAGRGDDTILGGGGYAYLSGGDGADKLYARGSSSDLFGNANSDQLVGGKGIDRLYGGGGNDRLSGGPIATTSDGLHSASATDDLLVGGRGVDRATQDDRDLFQSIESFF